jgi:hypothetical protein
MDAILFKKLPYTFGFALGLAASTTTKSVETTNAFVNDTYKKTANTTQEVLENRGGLANLTGEIIVPSQHNETDNISKVIDIVNSRGEIILNKFNYTIKDDTIYGVICYPLSWNQDDQSRCILYHNPNGVITSQYFYNGIDLKGVPGKLFNLYKCPIILYDYRGTGFWKEQQIQNSQMKPFKPNSASIVDDGILATHFALDIFKQVDIWGSCLGGGVCTASLEKYLKKNEDDVSRVSLYNHDSFSSTPQIILPNTESWFSDTVGEIIGANINAIKPMRSLIKRGVKVIILAQDDTLIAKGARMIDKMSKEKKQDNVFLFESPTRGHANLTKPMIKELKRLKNSDN